MSAKVSFTTATTGQEVLMVTEQSATSLITSAPDDKESIETHGFLLATDAADHSIRLKCM